MEFTDPSCLISCYGQPGALSLIGGGLLLAYLLYHARTLIPIYSLRVGMLFASIMLTVSPILYTAIQMLCVTNVPLCNVVQSVGFVLPLAALTVAAAFYLFGTQLYLIAIGAKELKRNDAPHVFSAYDNIQKKYKSRPRFFYVDSSTEQVFSLSGREDVIVVSFNLIEQLGREGFKVILHHEMQHLQRKDPFIKFASILISILAPTGLLNRAAIKALIREQEKD